MNHVVVTVILPSGEKKDLALPLDAPAGLLAERVAHKLNLKEEASYTFFVQRKTQRLRVWPEFTLGRFPLRHGMNLYLAQDPEAKERRSGASGQGGKAILVSALGRNFPLQEGETLIGRRDPARGVFPDIDLSRLDAERTVSRRHARITVRDGQYWLEDLNSVNGTRHNGKLLPPNTPVALQPGDRIEFGRGVAVFEFQYPAQGVEMPHSETRR